MTDLSLFDPGPPVEPLPHEPIELTVHVVARTTVTVDLVQWVRDHPDEWADCDQDPERVIGLICAEQEEDADLGFDDAEAEVDPIPGHHDLKARLLDALLPRYQTPFVGD